MTRIPSPLHTDIVRVSIRKGGWVNVQFDTVDRRSEQREVVGNSGGESGIGCYSPVAKVFVIAMERATTEHPMKMKNRNFTTTT
jgi:hypothetical protein